MRSLASATPSIRRSARSAPNIRSALSDLLAQSGGRRRVISLIKRRFPSAALVSNEASHSHRLMMTGFTHEVLEVEGYACLGNCESPLALRGAVVSKPRGVIAERVQLPGWPHA